MLLLRHAVAVVLFATTLSSAAEANKPDRRDQSFRKKVVAVYVRDTKLSGGYLEDVSIRTLAGRDFIVGKYPAAPGKKKSKPITAWIPLSEVIQIIEFESMEHAIEVYELQKKWVDKNSEPAAFLGMPESPR